MRALEAGRLNLQACGPRCHQQSRGRAYTGLGATTGAQSRPIMAMSLEQPLAVEAATVEDEVLEDAAMSVTPDQSGERACHRADAECSS